MHPAPSISRCIIPCGDDLVQFGRAPAVLYDASASTHGEAATLPALHACGALRKLGVALADSSFALKAIASELQPLTGGGIVAAITRLGEEKGGIAGLPWRDLDSGERAAILDLISRDVGALEHEEETSGQLKQLALFPLFAYEDATDSFGPSSCAALGPESRRWTKPELQMGGHGVPAQFSTADGTPSRFLSRIPATAPRAVLYSALGVSAMSLSNYFANIVFGGSWHTLDEATQIAQLEELASHYESIKDEAVASADGSTSTFAAFFASAPLFRSASNGGPRRVTELLDPKVDLHMAFPNPNPTALTLTPTLTLTP